MNYRFGFVLGLLAAGAAGFAPASHAGSGQPIAHTAVGPLTPAERGAMTRAYVLKWGPYVQKVYDVPVAVWARRMVPTFVRADANNFRNALMRTTYEGASAMLSGAGAKVSDDQVIDSLARASLLSAASTSQLVAAALGAATSDLVYTPITPCRILDTRIAGGPIAGSFSRDFNTVVGSGGNFSSQGGSATDCGAVAAGQSAVVINVTAITPTSSGYATVYPFGAARPLASSVNYAAGAIVNNTVVAKLPNPLTTKDVTIFTLATSDYVADIVGYYAPPRVTALDCTFLYAAPVTVAPGSYTSLAAMYCPATYTAVGSGFSAVENVVLADSYLDSNYGQVYVRSLSANAQSVTAKLTCCRVPGR